MRPRQAPWPNGESNAAWSGPGAVIASLCRFMPIYAAFTLVYTVFRYLHQFTLFSGLWAWSGGLGAPRGAPSSGGPGGHLEASREASSPSGLLNG